MAVPGESHIFTFLFLPSFLFSWPLDLLINGLLGKGGKHYQTEVTFINISPEDMTKLKNVLDTSHNLSDGPTGRKHGSLR